jgi:Uma2 family endonuclease
MNIQSKMPMTSDQFLVWNEGREGKREFVLGKVVEHMMINTTRNHARLCTNVLVALANKLDTIDFGIGSADFAVETAHGVRYPDVFVDKTTALSKPDDLAARHPMLLVEVLSPSSYTRDFGEKVEDYQQLPTLLHYVILAQDEARAWVWSRTGNLWQGPIQITGHEAIVELPGLGIEINLNALYRGIF